MRGIAFWFFFTASAAVSDGARSPEAAVCFVSFRKWLNFNTASA
jgi:hypothetical protein